MLRCSCTRAPCKDHDLAVQAPTRFGHWASGRHWRRRFRRIECCLFQYHLFLCELYERNPLIVILRFVHLFVLLLQPCTTIRGSPDRRYRNHSSRVKLPRLAATTHDESRIGLHPTMIACDTNQQLQQHDHHSTCIASARKPRPSTQECVYCPMYN